MSLAELMQTVHLCEANMPALWLLRSLAEAAEYFGIRKEDFANGLVAADIDGSFGAALNFIKKYDCETLVEP